MLDIPDCNGKSDLFFLHCEACNMPAWTNLEAYMDLEELYRLLRSAHAFADMMDPMVGKVMAASDGEISEIIAATIR